MFFTIGPKMYPVTPVMQTPNMQQKTILSSLFAFLMIVLWSFDVPGD
jgi:hypothetical protein